MEPSNNTFSPKKWTLFTFYGWLLGVVFILMLSSFLDSIGIEHMQFYLGVGMGAGVSLTQWWLLRRMAPVQAVAWIGVAVLGMGIPFVVLDLLPDDTVPHKLAFSIVLGSVVTGVFQARLLRKHFSAATTWIGASALGWPLAVATVFIIDYTNQLKSIVVYNLLLALINLVLILAGGIVLGIITGAAMKRMQQGA